MHLVKVSLKFFDFVEIPPSVGRGWNSRVKVERYACCIVRLNTTSSYLACDFKARKTNEFGGSWVVLQLDETGGLFSIPPLDRLEFSYLADAIDKEYRAIADSRRIEAELIRIDWEGMSEPIGDGYALGRTLREQRDGKDWVWCVTTLKYQKNGKKPWDFQATEEKPGRRKRKTSFRSLRRPLLTTGRTGEARLHLSARPGYVSPATHV